MIEVVSPHKEKNLKYEYNIIYIFYLFIFSLAENFNNRVEN